MPRPEDIQTAVGLFRVSTEAQRDEGYSLQAQQAAYERDCRTYGWRSLAVYEGQETGSALIHRRTVHALINCLRDRRPDAVWVIEQSRLTRGDELDVALLLRELRENGTRVVTERGHVVDPGDLEGAFHFRLKALMDRREWEVIAARNKRGKDQKAAQGFSVSGRPAYGYRSAGEGREKGRRVAVAEEAAVVKMIFEWRASGLSIKRIIQRLHEAGVPAPTQVGRPSGRKPERFDDGLQLWGRTTIRRILANPLYIGVSFRNCWIRRGKSFVFEPDPNKNPAVIWVENAHQPIVPRELWHAVQRLNQQARPRTHSVPHLLTGLLICPVCGNTYNTTISRDGRGHENNYYFCRSKRQLRDEYGGYRRTGRACKSRWLRLEETDRRIWDAFVRLISGPEMVEQYLASAEAEKRQARLREEIAQLEETVERIDNMLARARQKLLTEILTDGEYLCERERLDTELQGLQKRVLAKRRQLQSAGGAAVRQVVQQLALLKLGEKKLSRDQRSRLFHALVRRVVPNDEQLSRVDIELYAKERDSEIMAPGLGPADEPLVVSMQLPIAPSA
jgi:site-specific DNA recombinase